MSNPINHVVALLFVTFILPQTTRAQVASPTTGLEAPIGKVLVANGPVTIEHAAAVVLQANLPSDQLQAKVGDFVYQGDVLQTGANAKAEITFTDGTAFNLDSNARMELNEFIYNANSKSNSSFFTLSKGIFTFVAGNVAKTGDMKIDTALASIGIRGTTPHVEVSEDGNVKFSTLIEEKKNPPAGAPGRSSRTPQEDSAYDRLIKLKPNICRGC